MGLGLANAYGTEALSKAIQDIIAQKKSEAIAAQAEAYKRSQDAVKNGQQDRIIGADEGRLKLAQNQFSDIQKPESIANIANTVSQTNERNQTTGFAADTRQRALGNLSMIPDAAPAPGRLSPRLIAGLKQFNGIDFATPAGERATVSPGNLGAEAGQTEASSFDNGGSKVYRQKLGYDTAAKIAVENAKPSSSSADKAPTGAERQTRDFYGRMRSALDIMNETESQMTDNDASVIQSSPAPDFINNALLSEAGKKYAQALRSYTLAKLRKESGAAISAGEFSKEALTAARSRGDSPDVLKQKRDFREQVAQGFAASAGPAYAEFYGHPFDPNSATPAANGGNGPKVGERRTFNGKVGEWDGQGWKPVGP